MQTILSRVSGPAGRRFLAFFASNILQKTGQLVLLIGVTLLGSASDVYRFGLFISVFALVVPLFSLNIHLSVGRISFDIEDDEERARYMVACLLCGWAGVGAAAGVAVVSLLATGVVDPLTLGEPKLLAILCAALLLYVANQFFGLVLRLNDAARPFLMFGALSGAGAIVIFLAASSFGLPPLLAAIVGYSGAQLGAIGYAAFENRALFRRPSSEHLATGARYSIGTVIFASVQWVANYSGRWLAEGALPVRELAIYTLIGQALVALTMVLGMLYESRRPAILREFAASELESGERRINQSFLPALGFTAVFFAAASVANIVAPQLFGPDYQLQWSWIGSGLFMCLAYCLSMRTYWLSIGLSRTTTFSMAAIIGAICNLSFVVSYGLGMGIDGLFLGSAIGFLIQATIAHILLQRSMPKRASS